MATSDGLHALAKYSHAIGVSEFSPAKVQSDPIKLLLEADVLMLVYHCNFCLQLMRAFWVGIHKIHA